MSQSPSETPTDAVGAPHPARERGPGAPEATPVNGRTPGQADLPGIAAPLAPLIDGVARLPASVHSKLLAGFLVGAVLLFAMGLLSLLTIDRMSQEVERLSRLQEKVDLSHRMESLVTLQSHLRAMSLLLREDGYNDDILAAKNTFAQYLDAVERLSPPEQQEFFRTVRDANARHAATGDRVVGRYRAGDLDGAMLLHLSQEHPGSHELEVAMQRLQRDAAEGMAAAQREFATNRQGLIALVGAFALGSLLLALVLGFVLSWAFIRPVRRIDAALARLARGNFGQRVEVPNRDEFGALSHNLNVTSAELARVYGELHALNASLQAQVREQVAELERVGELKRFLSPQVADMIVSAGDERILESHRRDITVVFTDLRGFTAFAETVEPEELMGVLHEYHAAMGELIFRFQGTLERFTGDGLMVFFNDPVPVPDPTARAVRMAVAMRERADELARAWRNRGYELGFGVGIAQGYATLGMIGFEGRVDYAAIGTVTNLAARLCGEAAAGQILINPRVYQAVSDLLETEPVGELTLKGLARPVSALNVVGLRAS